MFIAFVNYDAKFYEADRPITVAEFRGMVLGSYIF
jgi:hypothetical protein